MTRTTGDTNVLISALLFKGLPGTFLSMAEAGRFKLLTSPVLLDELDDKLRNKFHWTVERANRARAYLESFCDVVSTITSLAVIKEDPDDDRVLECAVDGRADYIVSGDRHLLKLGEFRGIPILTVRQFMDTLSPAA